MTDEELADFEATIIEPLKQPRNGSSGHHPRMSTLEVVEEENTPGTTPSPSNYLPDIHHNQKVL